MTVSDLDYYEQRAEAELALAQASTHAEAVRAHYILAGHYLDLVHGSGESAPASPESA